MKHRNRAYLFSALVCIFAAIFALGIMAACGGEEKRDVTLAFDAGEGIDIPSVTGKPGDPVTPPADPVKEGFEFDGWYLDAECTGEKQTLPSVMPEKDTTYYGRWKALYTVSFDLAGGTLQAESFRLGEGDNLYAALEQYMPEREGYRFGKWTIGGEDVTEETKMPAGDVTVTAVWKAPVRVTVYTLNFLKYDEYVENGEATEYFYPGGTVDGSAFVPDHYTLNADRTGSFTVPVEGGEMSVWADPVYTRYTDVFESTDYLYALEAEEDVLYLDRIGFEEGRKKSTSYNKETGAFTFKTGDAADAFVLEGVISGEKFYYYRDTINRTFGDWLGSGATLDIVSANEVTYTSATGDVLEGGYTVDTEGGKYVFMPASGDPMEFVLIQSAGILYFRMNDGISGWYAYGGELAGGGWSILGFDGFGVATSIDDSGAELQYDYYAKGNGIIDLPELGLIKLADGVHEDLGGYKISGTFSQSDGYEGEYRNVTGGRTEILTLDGFGGASFAVYKSEVLDEAESTSGTYEIKKDETFLINGYDSYYGIYTVGNYGGVNKWIVYKPEGKGAITYNWSEDSDESGNTVLTFEEYHGDEEAYDVVPGKHSVTNTFTYKGTEYPVDENHNAFLYFHTDETVDLWYGGYEEDYGACVYDRVVYGEWYSHGHGLSNDALDYDGMYFKDMAEDGSFEFDHEDWEGEFQGYVFYEGEEGKLTVDAKGEALFTPTKGEPIPVSYEQIATGLIYVVKFTFPESVPAAVHSLYAVYDHYYDTSAEDGAGETIYDLEAENTHVYSLRTADGEDGGVTIVVTEDLTFIGVVFEYEDGTQMTEYVLAGETVLAEPSADEYVFTNSGSVYYDELDYIEDADSILAMFLEFRFKVIDGDACLYYDGNEGTYTQAGNGENTLVLDGYGTATLTEDGETVKGYYSLDYSVLTFLPENGSEEDARNFRLKDTEYTEIFYETNESILTGYYYEASLTEELLPGNILMGGLFLDGVDGFIYEKADFTDDYSDFEIETLEGTYRVTDFEQPFSGPVYAVATLWLTFADGDEREAKVYIYDYYGDGDYYPFFSLQNEALMGTYEAFTDDGAALGTLEGGDGYYEEGASFTGEDADGPFAYGGYMARGTIDDQYYNSAPQFTADETGDVVVFVTYIGGEMMQYVFDIEEDGTKVMYRGKFYGTLAEYKVNGGTTGRYLRLDGHSKATLYNSSDKVEQEGTYEFVETMEDTYAFKDASGTVQFLFTPSVTNFGGGVLYIYSVYGEEGDILCVNADWSVLRMDGFGNATYIDKYGVARYGEYYEVIEDEGVYCLKVTESTERIYYQLHRDDNTFSLCQGEFLTSEDGKTLYAYFGSDESVRIPDGVETIAGRAFALSGSSNVKHIDFNGVRTLEENALNAMWALEEVVSDSIVTVGPSAFRDIKTLVRVELLNCTEIGEYAFCGCNSIEVIKLGKIQKIGAYAFTRDINWCPAWTLDLTAAENIGNIQIDFTAFLATRGYFGTVNTTIMVDGSKILVGGGLEGLNAAAKALKGETAEISYHDIDGKAEDANKTGSITVDLTPYITLAVAEDDPADGLAFYDLASDTVLWFEGGLATLYQKNEDSYSYEGTESYAYFVENGNVTLFSYDEAQGKYVSIKAFELGDASVELKNVTYTKSDTEATATVKVNDKDIVITYMANVTNFYGVSVSLEIVGVTYGGTEVTFTYDSYNKVIEFTADGHGFTVKLEDGQFTATDNGLQYVLEDKSQDIWFRVTLGVSDGTVTLKKLEYNSDGETYPDSYYEAYSSDYKETETNTWEYNYYGVIYQLKVDLSAEGGPTLTVTTEGYCVSDSSSKYKVSLKVSEDKTQIVEITGLTDSYGDTVYQITEVTLNEGNTTATVTTDNGTFVIEIESSESASVGFQLTVTRTNYDYTETLYDSEYDYEATIKFHVDEQGKTTVTGLEKFQTNDMPAVVMEFDSATVDEEGVITVKFKDGKTAKIKVVQGSFNSIEIEWVNA